MIKKVICIVFFLSLYCSSVFAISIQEIRDNPDKYKLVYSDDREDEFIDIDSIDTVRYAPPYYSIQATAYAVYYGQDNLTVYENIYNYNFDRSANTLFKQYATANEVAREIFKNTGITWQARALQPFHLDGTPIAGRVPFDPMEMNTTQYAGWGSPSYQAANFLFLKTYNMYFNPPLKGQKF